MLATIMNALALQSGFENEGIITKLQSAIEISPKVAENYINEKAIEYLEEGKLVIFAGGTGRPYFTTDTCATLVASEVKADLILMGKNGIDGIYDSDPNKNSKAIKYDNLKYDEILTQELKVMDITAASMARENDIDIFVFNIQEDNAIVKALEGKLPLTKVTK
jgi:uridylate kinase